MARRPISSGHGGPRRERASRKQLKRYFIAAEGVAEQSLARWLEFLLTNKGEQIFFDVHKIGRGAGDPAALTTKAVAKRKNSSKGPFARAFLFLDRDTYSKGGLAAERLASTENLHLFWQQPNIEGLFLRFFDGCENKWPPANQITRALDRLWPGYNKSTVSRMDLSDNFTEADLMRARQHDEHLDTLLALLGFDD